jgi:hypothetical protein
MAKIVDLNKYRCDKHYEKYGNCNECEFCSDDLDDEYCKLGIAVEVTDKSGGIEFYE